MSQTYEDKPTLEAWNALATAAANVPEIVFGTYTGNGSGSESINLGRTPKIVLVEPAGGQRVLNNTIYGGLAAQGSPAKYGTRNVVYIIDNGFRVITDVVPSGYTINTNEAGTKFHYLAIF